MPRPNYLPENRAKFLDTIKKDSIVNIPMFGPDSVLSSIRGGLLDNGIAVSEQQLRKVLEYWAKERRLNVSF